MGETRAPEPPEPTEHYIFNDSLTVVLEHGFPWDSLPDLNPIERERMTAHHAVRALAELCEGLIRPMTFGVTRNWVDEFDLPAGGYPPRWNWFLRTPQSPPDARSIYVDPQVVETVTLDEQSMLTLVDRVLDDPCEAPEGVRLAWEEMRVDHTWARLPEPERHITNDELRIDDHDNKARRVLVPLEHRHGHMWVTRPKRMVWYPFLLRVNKYDDSIEMTISVNWSFWWHPGEGRAMLDRAVDRLVRQGWFTTHP
ncbi:hypothetical protein ACWC2K_33165 [Streptomyces chattanoogensis]